MQALLGYTSEARWLRYARMNLVAMVPHLPQQPGYNKRLRKLADSMRWLTGVLGQQVSVAGDDVWVADSTPVECGRSRETAKRSDLAGWAEYGYCAGHSRFRTTEAAPDGAPRHPDLVKREWDAPGRPDEIWVADFERHEAFLDLAVVRGHRSMPVAAGIW